MSEIRCPACGCSHILARVTSTQYLSGTREETSNYHVDEDGDVTEQYEELLTSPADFEIDSDEIESIDWYFCEDCDERNTSFDYFKQDPDDDETEDTDEEGFSLSAIKEKFNDE